MWLALASAAGSADMRRGAFTGSPLLALGAPPHFTAWDLALVRCRRACDIDSFL